MKTTKTLEQELHTAVALARQASAAILPFYYGSVEKTKKADGTPVTEADKLSNKIIVEGLQKSFPQDSIVSEELETMVGKSGRTWYVDPIDGTKGFIGHSDQFAIHIGLAEEGSTEEGSAEKGGKAIFGLVYKPTTGEYYVGGKGLAAVRIHPDGSRKILQVNKNLEGVVLIANTSFFQEQPELLAALQPRKTYVSGSMGLRWMRIAEGVANLYVKTRKDSGGTWDVCAPQAIVEAAGAYVATVNGVPLTYDGQRKLDTQIVVASTPGLGKYVAKIIGKLDTDFTLQKLRGEHHEH